MNPHRLFAATLLPACLALLALQGCQTAPLAASRAGLPIYSTDLAGKATSCVAPSVTPVGGKTINARIVTGGGGWCGIVVNNDGTPYTLGLLSQAATHGKVYVHTVGDDTRIDYTPYSGTSGPDSFIVRLLPGVAAVKVAVETPAATASNSGNK